MAAEPSLGEIIQAGNSASPEAATGTPAASDLPIVRMSGDRPQAATQPPGPAEIVCVSS